MWDTSIDIISWGIALLHRSCSSVVYCGWGLNGSAGRVLEHTIVQEQIGLEAAWHKLCYFQPRKLWLNTQQEVNAASHSLAWYCNIQLAALVNWIDPNWFMRRIYGLIWPMIFMGIVYYHNEESGPISFLVCHALNILRGWDLHITCLPTLETNHDLFSCTSTLYCIYALPTYFTKHVRPAIYSSIGSIKPPPLFHKMKRKPLECLH